MLIDSEIEYVADKVHVHRWPQNTPIWDVSIQKQLDDTINQKSKKQKIIIFKKTVFIEKFEFNSIKKIGVSVPFFKDECTLIFEAKFGKLSAHVHITTKSESFLDIFNRLIDWKNKL